MVDEDSQIMHMKYATPELKKRRIRLASVMVQTVRQFLLRAIHNKKDELDFVHYWYLFCENVH